MFRAFGFVELSSVAVVLRVSDDSQVGLAIVKLVEVDMVDQKIRGRLHYDAMHHYTAPATRLHAPAHAFAIPCAPTFLSLPFVFH